MSSPEALIYEAFEWVMTVCDPECSPSQLSALDGWLAVSPEHKKAFWAIDAALGRAADADDPVTQPVAETSKFVLPEPDARYHAAKSDHITPQRAGPKADERYVVQALQFEGAIRACLYHYTRNQSDTDDLLQEVYVRLLNAGANGGPQAPSVRALALRVARNVAFHWLNNREARRVAALDDLHVNSGEFQTVDDDRQVNEVLDCHDELKELVAAIEKLPARCRQVFTLRKVYGYSQQEIASRFNISETEVEQELKKAARRIAGGRLRSPHLG